MCVLILIPVCCLLKPVFFFAIFAAVKKVQRLSIQLMAWVLLVAFSVMTVTKSCHHHQVVMHEDKVCPLDGKLLSQHHESHAVFGMEIGTNDDDCQICHFSISKVVAPNLPRACFSLTGRLLSHRIVESAVGQEMPAYYLLRAPPCC